MIDLRCGDCLEVMPTIPSGSIAMVAADPPYGIDYQSAWRTDRSAWLPKIANDKEPFVAWLPEAFRVTKDGGALACFSAWKTQEVFRTAIEAVGYTIRSQVIWDRESHGMGDLEGEFAPQHDVIWFATKGRYAFPGKRPKSVIRCDRVPPNALKHPNEKPLRLMASLVRSICPPDDVVLDPFAGVATTLVACVKTGRDGIGIEINPDYVELGQRCLSAAETPLFEALPSSKDSTPCVASLF